MDALRELDLKIAELVEIAERAREEALGSLISLAATYDDSLDGSSRAEITELARSYVSWCAALDGYRALLADCRGRPVIVK